MMTENRVNHLKKTPPKSILKSSASILNHRTPIFFVGNETSIMKNFIRPETIYNDMRSYISPKTDTPKIKIEQKARFQASSLAARGAKAATNKSSLVKRRTVSDMYILHSTEVNKQIMKLLLKSTDTFLEEFKQKLGYEGFDDRSLMLLHRDTLIAGLRTFLQSHETDSYFEKMIGSSYNIKDQQKHNYEIGAGLSEPNIFEIHNLRGLYQKEKIIHAKSSASIARSCLNEPAIYGSLPTRSYLDKFTKELESHLPTNKLQAFGRIDSVSETKNLMSKARAAKKAVRFADSFGFDLEKVKIITNNSFSDFFTCPPEANEEEDAASQHNEAAANKPFLMLIPLFSLSNVSTEQNIKLQDYVFDYENKMIRCMIKVRNISFQKNVFARVTMNDWKSSYDLKAVYVKSERQKTKTEGVDSFCSFDFFGFCLIIPEKGQKNGNDTTIRIEFALCYEGGDHESFWDNNSGKNYKFQCFYER